MTRKNTITFASDDEFQAFIDKRSNKKALATKTEAPEKPKPKKARKRNELEHIDQCMFFEWVAVMAKTKDPLFSRVFAIPNGGHRNKTVGAKMKKEGQTPGMLDICWPLPRGQYHGLFHELKIRYADGRHNTPSNDQKDWIDYLASQNYKVAWSIGWESMRDAVLDYYELGLYTPQTDTPITHAHQLPADTTRAPNSRYIKILKYLVDVDLPVNTSLISQATKIPITSLHTTLARMQKAKYIDIKPNKGTSRKFFKHTKLGEHYLYSVLL